MASPQRAGSRHRRGVVSRETQNPGSELPSPPCGGSAWMPERAQCEHVLDDEITPYDRAREVCAGCGDVAEFWVEGAWYCYGCASCEVCQSPYCEGNHRV